jgi:hypothetical protein
MEKYLKDIIEKQDEKIDQIRDTMLWRTKEFKTMVVEWEIANEKVKAMESHLTNYILDSDKIHGKSMERRDTKIEEQAKRIEELENINSKLPCPERMKKLVLVNRDLQEGVQILHNEIRSKKKRILELENHNDESIHGFYNEDEMAEKIEQQLKPYINSEEPSE